MLIEAGIWIAWGALCIVWIVAARFTKPAARTTSNVVRRVQSAMTLAGYLLVTDLGNLGWLNRHLWPQSRAIAVTGLAMTCVGVAFAIWARLALGSNWSGKPTVKQEHELIVSGPYALARHPIYTGMLLAAVGTCIAVDQWRGLAGVALILAAFAIKIRIEERLMLETFPEEFPLYRRRVKALIPGIL